MLSGEGNAPRVLPKSPAEAAGLKPGNVITHVSGEPVANKATAALVRATGPARRSP